MAGFKAHIDENAKPCKSRGFRAQTYGTLADAEPLLNPFTMNRPTAKSKGKSDNAAQGLVFGVHYTVQVAAFLQLLQCQKRYEYWCHWGHSLEVASCLSSCIMNKPSEDQLSILADCDPPAKFCSASAPLRRPAVREQGKQATRCGDCWSSHKATPSKRHFPISAWLQKLINCCCDRQPPVRHCHSGTAEFKIHRDDLHGLSWQILTSDRCCMLLLSL